MTYRGTASDWSDRSDGSDRLPRLLAPAVPYAAVLIYHAGVVAIWLAAGRRPGVRQLLAGFRASAAVPLVLAGLAVGPIVYFAWPHVALDPQMGAVLSRFGLHGFPLAAFAVYSAVVNPAFEELHWRGVLFTETRRPAPVDALFAGYHVIVLALVVEWPVALAAAITLATAAWIWRVLAVRCGGLAVPYLSHLAADLAVIGAAWALMAR